MLILVKPPAIYSSNTWSNKSRKPIQNHITRPPLVKHASVEYQIRETSLDNTNQSAPVRNSICGQNLREIATSQTELPECQDLSILDLQTLRRDSKVKYSPPGSKPNIRLPQQDVFRVHKPGFHISSERVWFPRTVSVEVRTILASIQLWKFFANGSDHGKYWELNGSTVEISCWAYLAWLLAGMKNSPKNLCSHVIFIVFFKF